MAHVSNVVHLLVVFFFFFFVAKILLEYGHVHLFSIVYGCFHITTADLGYSSDSMTYKAESIEYLTLCWKCLLISELDAYVETWTYL